MNGNFPSHDIPTFQAGVKASTAPEIDQILAISDLKKQTLIYRNLISRVGPEQAQEELLRSGLPFDGQTHLLNHTAGDWLYKKYGDSGLVHCRDYFLSSCYHGFVIHAIGSGGVGALKGVMDICWKNGGFTVAVQCAHAIGHGILAYDGYKNLPKALSDCDRVAQESEDFPLYNCQDGAFMENIWAVHTDGKPSPDRWVKQEDIVYPCNSPKIAEKYRQACWSNQPMLMYQKLGDLGRVASECLKLTNSIFQTTCFDAIARQIHPLTQGSVDKTFRLCSTQPGDWRQKCILSIARAAFSVGDRQEPFEICARLEGETRVNCFRELGKMIVAYARSAEEKSSWCAKIPSTDRQQECLNQL